MRSASSAGTLVRVLEPPVKAGISQGGAYIDILHSVVEPPILCVRSLEGLHPKATHPISVPKTHTRAQVAPVTLPAPPPSLRH